MRVAAFVEGQAVQRQRLGGGLDVQQAPAAGPPPERGELLVRLRRRAGTCPSCRGKLLPRNSLRLPLACEFRPIERLGPGPCELVAGTAGHLAQRISTVVVFKVPEQEPLRMRRDDDFAVGRQRGLPFRQIRIAGLFGTNYVAVSSRRSPRATARPTRISRSIWSGSCVG